MKKIFLFLSFSVLLLACSKDEPNNRKTGDQGNVTAGQSVFQVNKEDIEKVVTAFLKQPVSSRQTGTVPVENRRRTFKECKRRIFPSKSFVFRPVGGWVYRCIGCRQAGRTCVCAFQQLGVEVRQEWASHRTSRYAGALALSNRYGSSICFRQSGDENHG